MLGPPQLAEAGEHVRVVLDVSQSMRRTDPGKLARLSTLLLYDLADPDVTLDDSFEVLPFHPTQHWRDPSDPPPLGIGPRLRPSHGGRQAFSRQIRALAYDAQWTYFYPGLKAALEDLVSTPGGRNDVRTVVIVTDGLPEPPTRDEELRRIRSELQPILAQERIWLYVLAFGPDAASRRDFFDALVQGDAGASLGKVFVDPQGDRLLDHMIDLFGHAFGYTRDAPQPTADRVAVDLEGGHTPDRAAVVVFAPRPKIPSLALESPVGAPRAPTSPSGVEGAADVGAGYSVQWVLSPFPGDHAVRTDARGGSVAVLRPTRLQLEIRPKPGRQALRTMAQTPFPLDVLVRPPGGAQGDPGESQISFRAHGPREGLDPETGAGVYAWFGKSGAPPSGPSRVTAEGRIYAVEPVFEKEPAPDEAFYVGYLEAQARRGAAIVGSLQGMAAHRVEVFPRLHIAPSPALGDAVPAGGDGVARALAQGDIACADFSLELDVGRLPHPGRPVYGLRAGLSSQQTPAWDGPLAGASLTLDGLPLETGHGQGRGGKAGPSEWSKGRSLAADELLGRHRLCVQLGRPAQDQEATVRLPLELTLLESPYDDFQVIEPFVLKVRIARPGILQRRGWLLVPLLVALAALAALWYLRDRPDLPEDLRVVVGRPGSPGSATALPRGPLWVRALGGVESRPIRIEGENRVLARVQPRRRELFRLKPSRGVRMESSPGAVPPKVTDGTLEAGKAVRLTTDDEVFELCLEYEP